jgi:hypothetical protein
VITVAGGAAEGGAIAKVAGTGGTP